MKLKHFMARVRKHGQPGNTYYVGGVHYTVSDFVKQLEEQGFDVICAYITTQNLIAKQQTAPEVTRAK